MLRHNLCGLYEDHSLMAFSKHHPGSAGGSYTRRTAHLSQGDRRIMTDSQASMSNKRATVQLEPQLVFCFEQQTINLLRNKHNFFSPRFQQSLN